MNKNFMSGLLKLISMYLVVTTFEYRKSTSDATRVVNVRNAHILHPRSLLFPPTAPTRVQFIGGVGIPLEDLNFESVTSGYVLKAEYFLPETADVFHQKIVPQTIHRRRRSVNETTSYERVKNNNFKNNISNISQSIRHEYHRKQLPQSEGTSSLNMQRKSGDHYRWIVYKAIETILNNSELNGHVCLLRSICEHAATPLDYEGGLLAEILRIILTPSTSHDKPVKDYQKEYLRAEILGRVGEDCEKVYNRCTTNLLMEIISVVF